MTSKNMKQPLWTPSPERIQSTQLHRFMEEVGTDNSLSFQGYDEFWDWSIENLEPFWRKVWNFCGVLGDGAEPVLRNEGDLFNSEFFPAASLNYAENLLAGLKQDPAIIFCHENGGRSELPPQSLRDQVSQLQQALAALGVGPGDRVAAYLPNIPETVVAMLATTSLGAVWSSCSPDFGVSGLKDRFGQIEPKVLFTADGYQYNGKSYNSIDTIAELAANLECVEAIIVIPFLNRNPSLDGLDQRGVDIRDLCEQYTACELTFTRVNFRDPLFILFSSGTTGLPKCFVHSVGGTLLHHLKEHQLQCDIKAGDRLLYFTTCGWAMWNWLVSALASGASLVLYDGSPTFPTIKCLPDIVSAEAVTHFGTSAKYIDLCNKKNLRPIEQYDFGSLRTILSTGSPLSADGFQYIYGNWKQDVCLSSISGGTDIIGCFVGGNPIGPVYAGQCQKRHLAMDVQVFDHEGRSITGEAGELVCLSPHPGMPLGFLNDPDRQRYYTAYFARYENIWCHSDWVELTPEGGMIFYGRSDATLNPGGVRIGTAEIYRQVESIDEILEAVVVGQNWDNDVRVILFVRLMSGVNLTESLIQRIKSHIRVKATPRHVPAIILSVPDIPRTHSGKISELAVRDVIHGSPVKNKDSLSNPAALKYFECLEELGGRPVQA